MKEKATQLSSIKKHTSFLKEESKQAIDNMFGNPLGQIDNMIEGTKVEEVCEHSELVSEVRWHQFPDYEMGDSEKYYVLVCKKCGEEDINVSNAYGKSLAPYQAAAQEAENIAMNKVVDSEKRYGYKVSENGVEEMKQKENLPYTAEIDNMFGNPLEQVDKLVDSVKPKTEAEEVAIQDSKLAKLEEFCTYIEELRKAGQLPEQLMKAAEPKPFLDGMTPSEFIQNRFNKMKGTSSSKTRDIIKTLDLLVEELKNRNVIK